jgi:single-strand DNA-binding protein
MFRAFFLKGENEMLNVVALLGRLTADPELKTTTNGTAVTTFALAVNRSFVGQNGERQADFIDVVAWRTTAEFVTKYFKKGQMMALQGSLQTRTYEDAQGNKRKVTQVVAESVYFCASKSTGVDTATVTPPAAAATAPTTRTSAPSASTQTTLRGAVAEAQPPEEFVIVGDGEALPF